MIVVRFYGGLGNQILQYSFGKYLIKKGGDVVFDNSLFESNSFHNGLLIDEIFEIKERIQSCEISLFDKIAKSIAYFVHRWTSIVFTFRYINDQIFFQKRNDIFNSWEKMLMKNNTFSVFEGSWMAYDFLQEVKQELVIKRKKNSNSLVKDKAVCIHVRRGDYMNADNRSHYPLCSFEYYAKAIQHIQKDDSQIEFHIFTDDKEWAKDNIIDKFVNSKLINEDNAMADKDEFISMLDYQYYIIANSTFSWCAASLSTPKRVFYPLNWYSNPQKYPSYTVFSSQIIRESFIPIHWIGI